MDNIVDPMQHDVSNCQQIYKKQNKILPYILFSVNLNKQNRHGYQSQFSGDAVRDKFQSNVQHGVKQCPQINVLVDFCIDDNPPPQNACTAAPPAYIYLFPEDNIPAATRVFFVLNCPGLLVQALCLNLLALPF